MKEDRGQMGRHGSVIGFRIAMACPEIFIEGRV